MNILKVISTLVSISVAASSTTSFAQTSADKDAKVAQVQLQVKALNRHLKTYEELKRLSDKIDTAKSDATKELWIGVSLTAFSVITGLAGVARFGLNGVGTGSPGAKLDVISGSLFTASAASGIGAYFMFRSRHEAQVTLQGLMDQILALADAEQALIDNK